MTVGDRLRELRGAENDPPDVSQVALWQASGVNLRTIQLIETGKVDPKFGTLQKLAAGLTKLLGRPISTADFATDAEQASA